MLGSAVSVVGVTDVGDEELLDAVSGAGGNATEGLEGSLVLGQLLGGLAVGLELVDGRLDDDLALAAVDDAHVAGLDDAGDALDGEDSRNLKSAADDGGVGGAATGLGDDSGDVLLVDVGGHGRRELGHDDDGVLGQRGEVNELLAQQEGKEAGADVGDVGGALAEELVLHGREHVVVHVVGSLDSLLGADAGVDVGDDLLDDAVILGELNVSAHDASLGHEATGLHGLNLLVGHLDEASASILVAGLLGGRILNGLGGEGQIGLDRNTCDTNADTVRSVNAFVHMNPPLSKMLTTRFKRASHKATPQGSQTYVGYLPASRSSMILSRRSTTRSMVARFAMPLLAAVAVPHAEAKRRAVS